MLHWAREEVMKPDFLDNNFLSNDQRYPITLLQTNASRALQDNATRGKIWEEFSSEDYKQTPSIGRDRRFTTRSRNVDYKFKAPGGGPGLLSRADAGRDLGGRAVSAQQRSRRITTAIPRSRAGCAPLTMRSTRCSIRRNGTA